MSALIPIQLQSALNFESLHQNLIVLRQELSLVESKAQSASFSIKKVFGNLTDRVLARVNEMLDGIETSVVPKDQFNNFELGLVTLDEYAAFDTMDYYNGLLKLRLYVLGIRAAVLELQEIQPRAIFPSIEVVDEVVDTLTEEEFITQGYANPVVDAIPEWGYYTVVDGDTLMRIAQKQLGDHLAWPEIARANPDLSDKELIAGTQIGRVIKIPLDSGTIAGRGASNLVYEPAFDGFSQRSIDRFFYGRDFKLSFPSGKRVGSFIVDGNGDLSLMEGPECTIENVLDRYRLSRGNLNPQSPGFGLMPVIDPGGIPFPIFLENLFVDMEAQANADPRVLNATVLRRNMTLSGDALRVPMQIKMLSGITETVTIQNPQQAVI